MNLLQQSEKLTWIWCGKPILLKDMHYTQLKSVLSTLRRFPSTWHGYSAKAWETAINTVLRHNHLKAYKTDNSIKMANHNANRAMFIVKSKIK